MPNRPAVSFRSEPGICHEMRSGSLVTQARRVFPMPSLVHGWHIDTVPGKGLPCVRELKSIIPSFPSPPSLGSGAGGERPKQVSTPKESSSMTRQDTHMSSRNDRSFQSSVSTPAYPSHIHSHMVPRRHGSAQAGLRR